MSIASQGQPASRIRLTRRRIQILQCIYDYIKSHGFPPSIREIGQTVGLSSSSTIHIHLDRLVTMGLLNREPSKPRCAQITQAGRAALGLEPAAASSRMKQLEHQLLEVCAAVGALRLPGDVRARIEDAQMFARQEATA